MQVRSSITITAPEPAIVPAAASGLEGEADVEPVGHRAPAPTSRPG